MGRDIGGSFKREGTHVYLWLIHVEVWRTQQNLQSIYLSIKNKLIKQEHAIVRNNSEKSLVHVPPVVNILQNHNKISYPGYWHQYNSFILDFRSFIYLFICLYSYNHSKNTEQCDATRILVLLFYNFTHSLLISFHSDWQILIYLPFLQSCHFKQKHRICNLLFCFFFSHKIIPQRFIQDDVGIICFLFVNSCP